MQTDALEQVEICFSCLLEEDDVVGNKDVCKCCGYFKLHATDCHTWFLKLNRYGLTNIVHNVSVTAVCDTNHLLVPEFLDNSRVYLMANL